MVRIRVEMKSTHMGNEDNVPMPPTHMVHDYMGGAQEKGKDEEENSRAHREQILSQQRSEVKLRAWSVMTQFEIYLGPYRGLVTFKPARDFLHSQGYMARAGS
jgi:hypothetical protein